MSGIVGILNLDGVPVDTVLLQQLTQSLAFRGPDAQATWADGPVGLGHTLLRTTTESAGERQPGTRDGEIWITADARIDGRAELIGRLRAKNCEVSDRSPDLTLILSAYQVWGEDCLHYLLGDFVFAMWDQRRQALFCARDHFGIKPFFYALRQRTLYFSNTLNVLRRVPGVSDTLDDLAIADYFLTRYTLDPAATVFTDIRRLPPAHRLTCLGSRLDIRRYWTLPTDGHIRYKRPAMYVEQFRDHLRTAVADRLRAEPIGVFMSGGLDSSSVAAMAHRVGGKVRAYTIAYDRDIPDTERHYAGLVAGHLQIPIEHLVSDGARLHAHWDQEALDRPEPVNDVFGAIALQQYKLAAQHGRVVLSGFGGDPLLASSHAYFLDQLKSFSLYALISGTWRYTTLHRRLPPFYLRSAVRRMLGQHQSNQPAFPTWLNPDFVAGLHLQERWAQFNRENELAEMRSLHAHREAYLSLTSPYWPALIFDRGDPGFTQHLVETRYPFFDLRLVNFVMAIPPAPWCLHKQILREAMRGFLPEAVRRRPKTLLPGNLIRQRLPYDSEKWTSLLATTPQLDAYVDTPKFLAHIQKLYAIHPYAEYSLAMRPISLAFWFRSQKVQPAGTQRAATLPVAGQ